MRWTLPFTPIRAEMYSPHELYDAFEGADVNAFVSTDDFAIYKFWIVSGATRPNDSLAPMMEALHDNSITQALQAHLAGRHVVAIMGGHDLSRSDADYVKIAGIARQLSRRKRLVVSGGGPGAMEAAHLGAWYKNASEEEFGLALRGIAEVPGFPVGANTMVGPDGTVNMALAAAVATWLAPSFKVKRSLSVSPGESLGIPTWQYGHEPSTPLATHLAKYFENSVREDGLVTLGNAGIIYAPGSAGTIQEIFQDACVNYYGTGRAFSPMVFLNEGYWTVSRPVVPVLKSLFKPADFCKYVFATDDPEAAVDFVTSSA